MDVVRSLIVSHLLAMHWLVLLSSLIELGIREVKKSYKSGTKQVP
jgi:hypothetical protein